MRILSVTQTYAPFWEFGGPPVKVQALARGLAGRGHRVTVLTADWGLEKRLRAADYEAKADESLAIEPSRFGPRSVEHGVTTFYLPTLLRYRALSWNPSVNRFCREHLKDFDIAHIFGLYDLLGPAVADACVRQKTPYVLEPIGMFVPIVRSVWLKRMYHARYGRRLFEGASAVVATSELEIEELMRGGIARDKIVLRRNGVEKPGTWPERGTFRKRLNLADDAKVILFLGRLSKKKSPDLLLHAFGTLAKAEGAGDLRLVFAGPDEGGMKAGLQRIAGELGLRSSVHFVDAIFGNEKWAAYRDADVFVLPSQNENFGNTAAESIAAGTPVVVTDKCGIAPLVAARGGLVVPHDAGALARAIHRVVREPDLHAQLAAGCGVVAQSLEWTEPVLETESLCEGLVKRRQIINNK